ncbi:DUF202 domain-containing protein [Nocardioides gansuensis]|uniref:DUF202 domain-containing protein n=1 Tax=Nocardioides gansuensis TaxID=2138300 RepID=UPI001403C375
MARPLDRTAAPERDLGLQPERTSLAWARTILGYLVVATISLKTANHSGLLGVASAVAYLGIAVVVAFRRRPHHVRSLEGIRTGQVRPPVIDVLVLSLVTSALSCHWLWLVVL